MEEQNSRQYRDDDRADITYPEILHTGWAGNPNNRIFEGMPAELYLVFESGITEVPNRICVVPGGASDPAVWISGGCERDYQRGTVG